MRYIPDIKNRLILTLYLAFNICLCFAQSQQTLRGTVHDENGKPFPYVNIFLTKSKIGTVTNSEGAFSLHIPPHQEDVLNASFIGYETVSMKVSPQTPPIKIRMKQSSLLLDEVVVTNLSAAELLKKAVRKIPVNYQTTPFLTKAYYRAKLSEKDTLRYMEETAFNIIKSYRSGFEDRYYLVKNRNFKLKENTTLHGIGNYDVVKNANNTFDARFFKRNSVTYLPNTTFDNRGVYVLSIIPKRKDGKRESKIYIDTEDFAFLRFELKMESGDELIAQYKKEDGKYFLMNGYSLHINKRMNRIFPAESHMIVTDIRYPFSVENIQGIPVREKDILKVYATSAQDTLFWQKHNAILPDSSIVNALKNYEIQKHDSITYKNGEQYNTYVKRLYTPNLSFIVSTDQINDFAAFNYNTNALNRYVAHLLQRYLHGMPKQQFGIFLYQTFISVPMEEVASEWLLLHKNGISARINPFYFNRYKKPYLYGVNNHTLADFKRQNHLDFMRLHTIRNDGHYVKSFMIEEELAKADLSNKNNWLTYFQLYSMELSMHRAANLYNPFRKDMKQTNHPEEKQPLIVDNSRSWVNYLFHSDAPYQRHISGENLSAEEQKYLKRSALWSWLNIISPQMYGIPKFKLTDKDSFTFSLNYLRTPFGEMFGQNIWLMYNYNQLHGIFFKQYRNHSNTMIGIGYKLYDTRLGKNLSVTTSLDYWQQPLDFLFNTTEAFNGFHIGQKINYQLMPNRYDKRNKLSLFLGYDYKTKGYMPESLFMDSNFNIKIGFKVFMR